jgi:hypothetical protein
VHVHVRSDLITAVVGSALARCFERGELIRVLGRNASVGQVMAASAVMVVAALTFPQAGVQKWGQRRARLSRNA